MKAAVYYRRAFDDARFRREQLDELRYFKKVEIGMLIVAGAGFVLHTLYFGLAEQKWDTGGWWLVMFLLSGASYVACATSLAALEAIDETMEAIARAGSPAQPSISSVSPLDVAS
jgi:hypothetical protein